MRHQTRADGLLVAVNGGVQNALVLGIHIAALEGTTALQALLDHMPEYAIDEDRVETLRSEFVAGIVGLPATWKTG